MDAWRLARMPVTTISSSSTGASLSVWAIEGACAVAPSANAMAWTSGFLRNVIFCI